MFLYVPYGGPFIYDWEEVVHAEWLLLDARVKLPGTHITDAMKVPFF